MTEHQPGLINACCRLAAAVGSIAVMDDFIAALRARDARLAHTLEEACERVLPFGPNGEPFEHTPADPDRPVPMHGSTTTLREVCSDLADGCCDLSAGEATVDSLRALAAAGVTLADLAGGLAVEVSNWYGPDGDNDDMED